MLSLNTVLKFYLANFLYPELSSEETLGLAETSFPGYYIGISDSEQYAGYTIFISCRDKRFSKVFSYQEMERAIANEDAAQEWAQNVYFPWLEDNLRTKKRTLVRMVV